jgi:hypothetical protein
MSSDMNSPASVMALGGEAEGVSTGHNPDGQCGDFSGFPPQRNEPADEGLKGSPSAIHPETFTHPKTGAPVAYGRGAICTTVACILDEVRRARGMFPGPNRNFGALIEEVGELAEALIEQGGKKTSADVFKEAVQVAAMAIRMLEEGSPEYSYRGPLTADDDAMRRREVLPPLAEEPL